MSDTADQYNKRLRDMRESPARIAELEDDLRRSNNMFLDVARSRDRLQERCDKLEWMLSEAIEDGPGYYPRDALELRWKEATS